MARRRLTDRTLKTLTPAPEGKRYEIMDLEAPGLGVRVTDKGHVSFVFAARFPGSKNYTRREIDHVTTLAEAREAARQWRTQIRAGIDPAVARERERAAALRSQATTLGFVAETWFVEKLSTERRGMDVEREFRNIVLPRWAARPITEITDLDVLEIIRAKKQTAPGAARNLFSSLRRFFNWVIDQRVYGLSASPCDRLKPTKIIGKKKKRQRTLSDDELFALWRATSREPYPFRELYRILMLSAVRLNEAAGTKKAELGHNSRLWTIPAERMKGSDEEARAHVVPLTDDIAEVFFSLPKFSGPHVFSCTSGKKPVWIGSLVKRRLDRRMLRTLRALARQRGEDNPAAVELPNWVNHDIRRTVRSQLSRLKVAEEVREAVLAHARPDIKQVYDQHDYVDEKREALELWAARLRSIVNPPAPNVVELRPIKVAAS